MKSLSSLVVLALLAGCNPFGGSDEPAPTATPAPVAAPAPVAPAPAAVPVLVCATDGGDVLIGTDLYHTVGTDTVIVKGVKPDAGGNCVTKAGHNVELTCFTEGGACASDVKLVGVAGYAPADPAKRKPSAFQPTARVTADGSSTSASSAAAYQIGVKALRAVGLVQANDKVQDEKIARLSKCATGDEDACQSFSVEGGPPTTETAAATTPPTGSAATTPTTTAPAAAPVDRDADPDDAPPARAARASRSGS